jgi:cyclic nucleotide-binding protein
MRFERAVTTVSWIPSDSLSGMLKAGEKLGVAHHDEPPPDALGDAVADTLQMLRLHDRYRFANHLRAWVEVEDGEIVASGYSGKGFMGSTTVSLGVGDMTVQAVSYPDLPAEPEVGEGWVRFRQTTGGRTGVPIPRKVKRAPFFQISSPTVWTTLELTIWADGRHEGKLVGASGFPRHWVYDDTGALVAKSGLTDLKSWLNTSFGQQTPWGTHDAEVLVTEVESALERELSTQLMRSGAADVIRLREGDVVVEQGQRSTSVLVVLDGVLAVEVDGREVAELGPGAVVGERAGLEGGVRTATLRCTTPVRVAVASADTVDRDRLVKLSEAHRREEGNEAATT